MEYNIKQNEPLAKYCTYKIGGPARCMLAAASEDEVIAALQVAQSLGCPFLCWAAEAMFCSRIAISRDGHPHAK